MRLAGSLLALLLSSACSSEPGAGGAPDPESPDAGPSCPARGAELPPIDGPLASPGDFEREQCEPGTLRDLDPSGLWYVHPVEERRFGFGTGPLRLAFDCEAGLDAETSFFAEVGATALSRDDLFLRSSFSFGNSENVLAWDFCRRNEDGTLSGRIEACFIEGEEQQCFGQPVVLAPFGRIEGEGEAAGLEEVAHFRGAGEGWPRGLTTNVEAEDGLAYVTRAGDGLRILDVSDPASPEEIGFFAGEEGFFNDIALLDGPEGGRFAVVADDAGALVVDVSDPSSPTEVTRFGDSVHRLDAETTDGQTRVYLAEGSSPVMPIYDLTNPAEPALLGEYRVDNPEWGFHAMRVRDQVAYINATQGGMLIVDVADPEAPVLLGQFGEGGVRFSHHNDVTTVGERLVSVHGDEGYGAHIEIVDVAPDSETFGDRIGAWETRPEVSAHNIQVVGSTAYVAYYQDGLRVLDVSDPTAPEEIAHYNTWDPEGSLSTLIGAFDVDVDPETGLVYVADSPEGLFILRETD